MQSRRTSAACLNCLVLCLSLASLESNVAAQDAVPSGKRNATHQAGNRLSATFAARGFSLNDVQLPNESSRFPVLRLKGVQFESMARFDWFPEGPSYRPADGSYFFSGNKALTRVDSKGRLHEVLALSPGWLGSDHRPCWTAAALSRWACCTARRREGNRCRK